MGRCEQSVRKVLILLNLGVQALPVCLHIVVVAAAAAVAAVPAAAAVVIVAFLLV